MPWIKRDVYHRTGHVCRLPQVSPSLAASVGIETGDMWVCDVCGSTYEVTVSNRGHDGWRFTKIKDALPGGVDD